VIKLLIPDMPTADEVLPFLRRIDANRQYVNGGPLVAEFERVLRNATCAPTVTVANATLGLELVLKALDFSATSTGLDDLPRVLVPSVTYVASALAIVNAGCIPILADVDAHTWKLEPSMARSIAMTQRIDAVMPVAAFGSPVDLAEWVGFSKETGIPVVIDAAGALTEQDCGGSPNVHVVFSLHATKFWGCGEGGAVACGSQDMADRIRGLACFAGPGATNAKMSEYHAAVGLADALRLAAKHERVMRVYDAYLEALNDDHRLVFQDEPTRGNYTLFPVLLPAGYYAARVADEMLKHGIECRQWYQPFLHERPSLDGIANMIRPMVVADGLSDCLLGLPFHTSLTAADIAQVCARLSACLA
jgi:dTDP-4-amino-4,6-dideoxygalactose transaminase